MALSAIPTLGSGSTFEYEDPAVVDTWIELDNILNIGEIGTEPGSFIEVTPISSTSAEFVPDRDEPIEGTFVFNDTSDAAYNTFLTDFVDTKSTVRVRITYANGRTAIVSAALASRKQSSPERGSQITCSVGYRQSGAPTYGATA